MATSRSSADLKEFGIPVVGSIAIENVDSEISEAGKLAERHAPGMPTDAVVWEEVAARTCENVELSWNYVAFMVLAVLIATAGIFLDSPILIIGAMVVGPEFGPLAGICVALVRRQRDTAVRSFKGARGRVSGRDHSGVPHLARNQRSSALNIGLASA